MNRRSFFGFIPAALAGVAFGATQENALQLSSAAWWRSVKLYADEAAAAVQPKRLSGFFTNPPLTPADREQFRKLFIDPVLDKEAFLRKVDIQPVRLPDDDRDTLCRALG